MDTPLDYKFNIVTQGKYRKKEPTAKQSIQHQMMATISRKFIEAEKTSTINEQEEVWAHNTVYFTNSEGLDECVDDPDVQNSSFDEL